MSPNTELARLAHSDDREEAVASVKNVLTFLARVAGAMRGNEYSAEECDGLSIILETCADTLGVAGATSSRGQSNSAES